MKSEANKAVFVYSRTFSFTCLRAPILVLAGSLFLGTMQGCSLFHSPQPQVVGSSQEETPPMEEKNTQHAETGESLTQHEASIARVLAASEDSPALSTNGQAPALESSAAVSSSIVSEKPAADRALTAASEETFSKSSHSLTSDQLALKPKTADDEESQKTEIANAPSTQTEDGAKTSKGSNIIDELNNAPAPAAGQAISKMPSNQPKQDAATATAVSQAVSSRQEAQQSIEEVLTNLKQPSRQDQVLDTFGMWELRRVWSGAQSSCRLTTHTLQVDSDKFTSQIWITVQPEHLILNASSEIHLDASGSGIRLDKGRLIPFTGQAIPSHAVLSDDLLNRLTKSQKLHLYVMIGDLQSRVTHTEINLKDLRAAVAAFNQCRTKS
ncbi:hypothetical protein [Hahella ganghwensis]|uniref:hypothetical protein n=1 Tax=Hahella ganghwensis TaxID=286420 RepID=UPI00039C43A1|nr:hypothetical protein [Hahella ganghwensis]